MGDKDVKQCWLVELPEGLTMDDVVGEWERDDGVWRVGDVVLAAVPVRPESLQICQQRDSGDYEPLEADISFVVRGGRLGSKGGAGSASGAARAAGRKRHRTDATPAVQLERYTRCHSFPNTKPAHKYVPLSAKRLKSEVKADHKLRKKSRKAIRETRSK